MASLLTLTLAGTSIAHNIEKHKPMTIFKHALMFYMFCTVNFSFVYYGTKRLNMVKEV
jgi:hypothetical protein